MERIWFGLAAFCAAYLLDYFIGDPRRFPHPVRLLGALINLLEKGARRFFASPGGLKAAGLVIVAIAAGGSALLVFALLAAAYRLHQAAGFVLETYILFTVLAGGDLRSHVVAVKEELDADRVDHACAAVSMLVSRDTANLDESSVSRAALESLFENSADGLVAPLFFAAIGGPAAAVLYKAVNTLDSMLGYMTEEYRDLGFFPARIDDILSYIPARLTAILILLAAFPGRKMKNGFQVLIRDRRRHQSPNSAWPEAAAAGALGLRFGGRDSYRGEGIERPLINSTGREATSADIGRGLTLFRNTSFLSFIVLLLLFYRLRTWEVLSL
jgi:adenosylcobinamide-phosphate synthase